MSISNRNGRALEFGYLLTLIAAAKLVPSISIVVKENSSFLAAKEAWEAIPDEMQKTFLLSATTGVKEILKAEPIILEQGYGDLEIEIQPDGAGKDGDVRDILITRQGLQWEIGISVKNNHFAVKHSRLSRKLDFGYKWFGVKCSQQYWDDISSVFQYLAECKKKELTWNELPSKENDVYIPLLSAFLAEIKRSYDIHGETLAKNMVEYLIGKYDFYKTISVNNRRLTRLQPYNLRGTLNRPSKKKHPKLIIPISALPTRIISAEFKPHSNNTVEVFMDEGWQFGFRIHNASTKVETSLKFDIQIIGMPTSIICIDFKWDD